MEGTWGGGGMGQKRETGAPQADGGARYSLFVTLRGGMQKLTATLASKLGSTIVRPGTRVKEVRQINGVWQVVKASGEILTADAICLALPAHAAANLVHDFDADLSPDLPSIPYTPPPPPNF